MVRSLSARVAFALLASTAAMGVAAPAWAEVITVSPGPDAQERLQQALLDAKPGDVVEIGAGRFELTDGLSLDVDRVTIRGAGPDHTVLSFKGQLGAGEGLLITSDDVVLRGFAVEDTKGDGIKSKGANRIVYKDIRVEWTGGPKPTNGAYGVYPVSSSQILIDSVTVRGASDAGIYVGQSEQIIVRNSFVSHNVAGIEIENSNFADVFDNTATKNTGGILVFDLPNLPRMNGGSVRVYNNRVFTNDTPNFAPPGNIVATVPKGTGVLVMANDGVHVFDNQLSDHATANIILLSYREKYDDPKYNPLPRHVVLSGNTHGRAGFGPGVEGGAFLAAAFGGQAPAIWWDGTGTIAGLGLNSTDSVPVLSLGLEKGAPPSAAKPSVVKLDAPAAARPAAVVLPKSMEDAAK